MLLRRIVAVMLLGVSTGACDCEAGLSNFADHIARTRRATEALKSRLGLDAHLETDVYRERTKITVLIKGLPNRPVDHAAVERIVRAEYPKVHEVDVAYELEVDVKKLWRRIGDASATAR